MAKWKLFVKQKTSDVAVQETKNKPLAEHSETLYSETKSAKKAETVPASDQRIWRDVQTIEKNIDTIHVNKESKPASDLDRTVDRLIAKKKK